MILIEHQDYKQVLGEACDLFVCVRGECVGTVGGVCKGECVRGSV